jgi:hypothetical protein
LLLAGCATPSIEARWIDRQIGPHSLAEATIWVVCQSSDLTLRLVRTDKIATPLKTFGAAALGTRPANAANAANAAILVKNLLDAARSAGYFSS